MPRKKKVDKKFFKLRRKEYLNDMLILNSPADVNQLLSYGEVPSSKLLYETNSFKSFIKDLDDDNIAITGVYRIDGFFGQVKKLQHTLSSKILIKHRKEFNNYKVVIEAEVLNIKYRKSSILEKILNKLEYIKLYIQ